MNKDRKKILIIEDEKEFSDALSERLESNGYEVHCVYDGESGYKEYLRWRPRLIILDISMPKCSGYEVTRLIRMEEKDFDTAIIMLTAQDGDADRIIGRVKGANIYLTKPADAAQLLEAIKKLIGYKDQ